MASDDEVKSFGGSFEWNVDNEIRLFEAMIGHKPVGINKHFHMACISEKFENLLGKPVLSDVIWKHLESMYDLAALDKKELLPFPNEPEEFSLPEAEYLELINEKIAARNETSSETKDVSKETRAFPKLVKDVVPGKDTTTKKDKKSDTEETGSVNDIEKKESTESDNESKKIKLYKEEKAVKTRGKRSTKEKKTEEETTQMPVFVNKKEEDNSSIPGSSKKERQAVGKRSLRSRVDESLPTKSATPPPMKRTRRI